MADEIETPENAEPEASTENPKAGDKPKKVAKIQDELDLIRLETARLDLEEARENNARRTSEKRQKERLNKQRQAQLSTDVANARALSRQCSHRQGGTPKNIYRGKGPTALNIVLMPDGFTKRVSCSICRLKVFSPFPPNQSKKIRKGETAEQRDARVAKFVADTEFFESLLEKAQDTLTPEASAPMDCGVKIRVTNDEGMPVYRPRPCDQYAA